MKTIHHAIEIVAENCTGCYRCERVCPTSAITMVGEQQHALAVVDNDRCIACFRCIDSCDDDAMLAIERDEPRVIEGATEDADPEAVLDLCRATAMNPDQMACMCSMTQVKEVAAAILGGADTFEKVALATGAQSGCLMYCSVPIRRLLRTATGEVRADAKVRRYPAELGLLEVSDEVAATYPLFNVAQEQRLRREFLAAVEIDL
jgi:ferredoxin